MHLLVPLLHKEVQEFSANFGACQHVSNDSKRLLRGYREANCASLPNRGFCSHRQRPRSLTSLGMTDLQRRKTSCSARKQKGHGGPLCSSVSSVVIFTPATSPRR